MSMFLRQLPKESIDEFMDSLLVIERDLQAALEILFDSPLDSDEHASAIRCLRALKEDRRLSRDEALDILAQY